MTFKLWIIFCIAASAAMLWDIRARRDHHEREQVRAVLKEYGL